VEYRLAGVNQVQARPSVGLTFAAALRSILRQDPDIVMVGEIRDFETAEIAVKAALTGHLVLSTLHTNNSIATIIRLLNMGIDKFLIASSVSVVIAQRLVRRVCSNCKKEVEVSEEIAGFFERIGSDVRKEPFYKGTGCKQCSGSGYWGRLAIHESLFMDHNIKEAIINDKSEIDLREAARQQGWRPLVEEGLVKARRGLTTLEEVIRVI
jgi:type IV pilus assembly protein PilB